MNKLLTISILIISIRGFSQIPIKMTGFLQQIHHNDSLIYDINNADVRVQYSLSEIKLVRKEILKKKEQNFLAFHLTFFQGDTMISNHGFEPFFWKLYLVQSRSDSSLFRSKWEISRKPFDSNRPKLAFSIENLFNGRWYNMEFDKESNKMKLISSDKFELSILFNEG